MVPLMSLWLPILLAAVVVFLASFVLHMVLPYHWSDYGKLPDEAGAMSALRGVPPGDYLFPKVNTPKDMKDAAFLEKWRAGPVGRLTILKTGPAPAMGRSLVLWFLFCVVVSIFAAYIAGRALQPGSPYLQAFRFAGATAFVAYSLGQFPESIWMGRPWATTVKSTVDGLIYALLTAGIFGWLWPK
jgi:hypothetical protein